HHATYGENLGQPGCPIPLPRYAWTATRPPVVLDLWDYRPDPACEVLTTIATLKNVGKDVRYHGETYYWSTDVNFRRFADLPGRPRALLVRFARGGGGGRAGDESRLRRPLPRRARAGRRVLRIGRRAARSARDRRTLMGVAAALRGTVVVLGCGFAAKYRLGGGNFSVPLQWMQGLCRLGLDALWLEIMPAGADADEDRRCIAAFERQLAEHGLDRRYCLLYQRVRDESHQLEGMDARGRTVEQLRSLLTGPSILLNLSYSVHPPLLLEFERRILCDLDPAEISYWMNRLEMGQSNHHEFWTVGLNRNGLDCALPEPIVPW